MVAAEEPVKTTCTKGDITQLYEKAFQQANETFDAIAQTPAQYRTPDTPAQSIDECLI